MRARNRNQGFTLIEVLVAISVMAVAVSSWNFRMKDSSLGAAPLLWPVAWFCCRSYRSPNPYVNVKSR